MPRIEFVYFDLGNVLLSFDPERALTNMASGLGTTAREVEQSLYLSGLQDRYEHGEVTGEQVATILRNQFGRSEADLTTAAFLEAGSDMFTPIESMIETVTQVQRSGIRCGLLSNTCQSHWDWVNRPTWPVAAISWATQILSCEVGAMKPNPVIYEAAEKAAGTRPDQILFLDDREENVIAAMDRGWNAVQCFGGEQAEAALKEFAVI
ncbi:HAD family hydrolase [Novipirellula artificiosorum]|uniref:Alpha-D-glucose-1-phosphate phosphatase YihX n=1 Tax=Novipirellula artificiosorum TaxID=2528016 RepID=A0A5C6E1D6_9BACT|nr:HAD family phosphatase [Novipirellula artificiosorum]TWU42712.1 Alpha-D-glucose-1-phosphate phosphatase YihX [Novipirellula artificiosorum]